MPLTEPYVVRAPTVRLDYLGRPVRSAVVRGWGLLRPIRQVTLDGETLRPERDRFDPGHSIVRAHPEWFMACDPADRATAEVHRAVLRAARREYPSWLLGPRRRSRSS